MEETTASQILTRKISGNNEIFSSIQYKLRHLAKPSIIVKVLERSSVDNQNKFTIESFAEVLNTELKLYLNEAEINLCEKRFTTAGYIDMNKFIAALDISVPTTHVDPEQFYDTLPQPYRMITKIIEHEVIDPVWLEITRLHPELLQNSEGGQLIVRRNQQLENSCIPTSIIELTTPLTSLKAIPSSHLVFACNTNGNISLYDPILKKSITSIEIFKPLDEELKQEHGSSLRLCGISDSLNRSHQLVVRVVSMYSILSPAAPAEAEKGGKSKKAAPVEDEVVIKVPQCSIQILEVTFDSLKSTSQLKVIHTLDYKMGAEEHIDNVMCDLSNDGELLTVSSTVYCSLYSLMPLDDIRLYKPEVTTDLVIDENKEVEKEEDFVFPEVLTLNSCSFEEFSFINEQRLRGLLFASLNKSLIINSNTTTNKHINNNDGEIKKNTEENIIQNIFEMEKLHSMYHSTSLVAIFENSKKWSLLGLKISQKSEPTSDEVSDEVTTYKSYNSYEIGTWNLQSIVTAYKFDEGKTILALGLQDGTISVWNLISPSLTCIVSRHERAITSLCFCKDISNNFFLSSGAYDGTLSFSQIRIPGVDETGKISHCLSSTLMDYRRDSGPVSIASIEAIRDYPLIVVNLVNGDNVLYDVQLCKLLGKLNLYNGAKAKLISFRPITMLESSKVDIMRKEFSDEHSITVIEKLVEEGENVNKVVYVNPIPPIEKRFKKYQVSEHSILSVFQAGSVNACSNGNFNCIYWNNDKLVMVSFNIGQIFTTYYPGINSLMPSMKEQGKTPEEIFNMIKSSERMDPILKENRTLTIVNESISEKPSNVPSRRGSLNDQKSQLSAKLTKEKLHDLQKTFDSIDSTLFNQTNKDNASIRANNMERISTPTDIAKRSSEQSQLYRASRTKKIFSSINELSNVFGSI
jgi:hypothetical protein